MVELTDDQGDFPVFLSATLNNDANKEEMEADGLITGHAVSKQGIARRSVCGHFAILRQAEQQEHASPHCSVMCERGPKPLAPATMSRAFLRACPCEGTV